MEAAHVLKIYTSGKIWLFVAHDSSDQFAVYVMNMTYSKYVMENIFGLC